MKRLGIVLLVSLFVFAFGCGRDGVLNPQSTSSPAVDVEAIAAEVIAVSGWAATDQPSQDLTAVSGKSVPLYTRTPLTGDIVHYEFQIPVGPGPYDMIGLHRVVKERQPHRPIQTRKSIFVQHGDAVGFTGVFLTGVASPNLPPSRSAAVYWAENDVDVWGIDQNWILVPQTTTDFSFMADWGIQNQVDNLNVGIAVARLVRRMTGSSYQKMLLAGYSSGVWTGYALLNQETQLPLGQRSVKGFVAVDGYYKTDDEAQRQADCVGAQDLTALLNSGVYQDDTPTLFRVLGQLAQMDPAGASPVFPGFTNYQAALFAGAATWELAPPPWYHYVGGYFDESGVPYDLRYTGPQVFFDFIQTASYYEPFRFERDYLVVGCDEEDVPFDDHLAQIQVPILEIGVAGGLVGLSNMGQFVGSGDFTYLEVQLLDPSERQLDIGHIDIWTANQAPGLFWDPILTWIEGRSPGGTGHGPERGESISD